MYYTATIARKSPDLIPQPPVPIQHFVSAAGDALDHSRVLHWYAELVSLHVVILKDILLKEAKVHPGLLELKALLDLLDKLPPDWSRQYLCHPLFCMWLNQVLASFEKTASLEGCLEKLHALPFLMVLLLPLIESDFQIPVWIGASLDPIGLSWGVSARTPGFFNLYVAHASQEVSIWQNGECLAKLSYESLRPSQKKSTVQALRQDLLKFHDRYYAADFIEITSYERYPHFGWSDYKHLDYEHSTPEILQSMDASFSYLEKSWPEAWLGLQTYARLMVVGSPLNLDSNNSASINIFPFAQALEVPLKNPLKNLESMIHEMSHCKLHMLLAGQALYENPDEDLSFRHPWLPYSRPLRGVLLGAHAFLNVLDLYARTALGCPETEAFCLEQFHLRSAEVEHVLFKEAVKGRFTPTGHEFLRLMQERYRNLEISVRVN